MAMTSRERMLTALGNGRPDRLPCQVHGWMPYYLDNYLDGMDWYQANEKFGMDYAIYVSPSYIFNDKDLANWQIKSKDLGHNQQGDALGLVTIDTPKGQLRYQTAGTPITTYVTEPLIKDKRDFEIWNEFYPVPVGIDFGEINKAKEKLGDRGIIRSHPFSPGQGSPWQSFCTLYETEKAIFLGMLEPDYLHFVLGEILKKTLKVTQMWEGIPSDMVEVGGGAGSNTVISPDFFREFCLPYELRQNELFHQAGLKVVLHLCGGLMAMLDLAAQSGADGLETMTPVSMGGDCDLAKASARVGDKLFFIGGFDQNAGFENGSPEAARRLVHECFEATRDHAGYICAPSDHFFHGSIETVQAFADAAKECVY